MPSPKRSSPSVFKTRSLVRPGPRQTFPEILDEEPRDGNVSLQQSRDTSCAFQNRTLEVWGSIPHGSTRKNKMVRRDAGRFCFRRSCLRNESLEVLRRGWPRSAIKVRGVVVRGSIDDSVH